MRNAPGKSPSRIGKELGRHHSSVSAEIKRNNMEGGYYPARAQALANCRRRDSKSPWKMSDPTIAAYVKDGLKRRWSPEQIAGRMKVDHPADESKRISHATIYRWIHKDKRQGGR